MYITLPQGEIYYHTFKFHIPDIWDIISPSHTHMHTHTHTNARAYVITGHSYPFNPHEYRSMAFDPQAWKDDDGMLYIAVATDGCNSTTRTMPCIDGMSMHLWRAPKLFSPQEVCMPFAVLLYCITYIKPARWFYFLSPPPLLLLAFVVVRWF